MARPGAVIFGRDVKRPEMGDSYVATMSLEAVVVVVVVVVLSVARWR
jgi:hypothetical protein